MSDLSLESLTKQKPDPLWHDGGAQEFDYDEIDRRMAFDSTPDSSGEAEFLEEMKLRLGVLAEWFAASSSERGAATRAVAFAWMMGKLSGLSQAGAARKFGLNKRLLSRACVSLTKDFNLKNVFQSHGRRSGRSQKLIVTFPEESKPDRN